MSYLIFLKGGDGLLHVATHNPLYITDHRDGGLGLITDYEKERETIFAGVYDGQAVGVGTICEFVSKEGADKADQSSTFQVRFFLSCKLPEKALFDLDWPKFWIWKKLRQFFGKVY